MAAKRDAGQEKEVMDFIEAVLGEKLFPTPESYERILQDGQVLCRLMNKLQPGCIKKINTGGGDFKMRENVQK